MSLTSSRSGHHECLSSCHLAWSSIKFKQSMVLIILISPHKIKEGEHHSSSVGALLMSLASSRSG
jgi:hypothetical protein